MKKHLFILLLPALFPAAGATQKPDCQGVFVRDFQTAGGQQTEMAQTLADDLEAAMLRQNCVVLLRSDHPDLAEKLNRFGNIRAFGDLPDTLRGDLIAAGARALVSGRFNLVNGGGADVTVSLLNLEYAAAPITKTIHFSAVELKDAGYRQRKIGYMVPGAVASGAAPAPAVRDEPGANISDELSLYQAFMKNPDGKNASAYLTNYPTGLYLTLIASRLGGECLNTRDPGKCQDFLALFPENKMAKKARRIITEIEEVLDQASGHIPEEEEPAPGSEEVEDENNDEPAGTTAPEKTKSGNKNDNTDPLASKITAKPGKNKQVGKAPKKKADKKREKSKSVSKVKKPVAAAKKKATPASAKKNKPKQKSESKSKSNTKPKPDPKSKPKSNPKSKPKSKL